MMVAPFGNATGRAQVSDVALLHHHRLVRERGGAGSVDDARVSERDDRRVGGHERLDGVAHRQTLRLARKR
jgi:hypothetical protein